MSWKERWGLAPAADEPPIDVTAMDYQQLRQIVQRWADGSSRSERAASFERAQQAYHELGARYRTDLHMFRKYGGVPPPELPPPPWTAPRQPRGIGWQRPTGSKCYPADDQRAVMAEYARMHWRDRNEQ